MIQELNLWLIGGGLVIGLLFGAVAQRSRFCVLAAVSNWVLMRDLRQAHAYLAAVAVAVAGTATLELTGLVPIAETGFRSGQIDWFGTLAGGTLFGIGAVLAGGCAGRLLVRSAEGSLGAVVALVAAGIGGAACAYGVLEPVRVQLHSALSFGPASGDASIASFLGLSHGWAASLVVTACLLAIIATLRRGTSIGLLLAGVLVGALVVGGWWISGSLAQDPFEGTVRPVSMTFVGPVAQATQLIATGEQRGNGFHLALIVGVLGGAVASALFCRQFRWVGIRPGELMRAVVGGGFVGVGAVFAGGCNIGQGLTGMSTLSISALLAVIGIGTGMRVGLVWLMHAESTQSIPGFRLTKVVQQFRGRFAGPSASLPESTKVVGCCH